MKLNKEGTLNTNLSENENLNFFKVSSKQDFCEKIKLIYLIKKIRAHLFKNPSEIEIILEALAKLKFDYF